MRVTGVLLEQVEQVLLVVRMQEIEVEEGFGTVGAGDSKDVVVYAKRGEGGKLVGMGRTEGAGEGAGTDESDNEEGGENKAEDDASDTEDESEYGCKDAGKWVGEVESPPDKDGGEETSQGDEEAGEAGSGHAGDGMKAFWREVANGEGAVMGVDNEDAVAVPMAIGEKEAGKGNADNKKEK